MRKEAKIFQKQILQINDKIVNLDIGFISLIPSKTFMIKFYIIKKTKSSLIRSR